MSVAHIIPYWQICSSRNLVQCYLMLKFTIFVKYLKLVLSILAYLHFKIFAQHLWNFCRTLILAMPIASEKNLLPHSKYAWMLHEIFRHNAQDVSLWDGHATNDIFTLEILPLSDPISSTLIMAQPNKGTKFPRVGRWTFYSNSLFIHLVYYSNWYNVRSVYPSANPSFS